MTHRGRRQAWTIAKIELRRAFFARRGLWVYVLALLPALIFFGHGLDAKWRIERLSRHGVIDPVLMNGIQKGEAIEAVQGASRHTRLKKTAARGSSVSGRKAPTAGRPRTSSNPRSTHVSSA